MSSGLANATPLSEKIRDVWRNSSRVHLDACVKGVAASIPAGSVVLDAGAGHAPYRHYFDHTQYETADFAQVTKKQYTSLDYVCDLDAIPVEDARYDAVVLTQVLEHLPDPLSVLHELRRVTKPGGTILLTTPLYFAEHEQPYDYFRYTQFALRSLLERADFVVDRTAWLEGYLGTVSYQLQLAGRNLPSKPSAYGGPVSGLIGLALTLPLRALFLITGFWFGRVDARRKWTNSGHPKNYVVAAHASEGKILD